MHALLPIEVTNHYLLSPAVRVAKVLLNLACHVTTEYEIPSAVEPLVTFVGVGVHVCLYVGHEPVHDVVRGMGPNDHVLDLLVQLRLDD